MNKTTQLGLGIGAAIGLGYAYKKGMLNDVLSKLKLDKLRSDAAPGTQTATAAQVGREQAPTPSTDEKQADSGDNSYDREEEAQESGGGAGGGSGGGFAGGSGGGGSGGGGGSAYDAGTPSTKASLGSAAAPAVVPATLTTGMLIKTTSPVLTPALRTGAIKSLVASTISAQRLSPIATQMTARPSLVSTSMPRPGIVAVRAAFPIMTPATRPTTSFQSALSSTARSLTSPAGRAPMSAPLGSRSRLVTRGATSSQSVATVARIVPRASGF